MDKLEELKKVLSLKEIEAQCNMSPRTIKVNRPVPAKYQAAIDELWAKEFSSDTTKSPEPKKEIKVKPDEPITEKVITLTISPAGALCIVDKTQKRHLLRRVIILDGYQLPSFDGLKQLAVPLAALGEKTQCGYKLKNILPSSPQP